MAVQGHSHPGFNAGYKLLMKRNSVYIMFILGGALLGERAVNYGFDTMWDRNNQGKLYKHLEGSVIGGATAGGDEE